MSVDTPEGPGYILACVQAYLDANPDDPKVIEFAAAMRALLKALEDGA